MGYKMNVKNCKFAPVSADTTETYTLGTAVNLPAIRTVDIAFTLATGELYGDGEIVSKRAKLTGATLRLGIDKLPQAARAAMLGHTVDGNGIMSIKTTDTPAKIAMYMEIELDDGGFEAVWLREQVRNLLPKSDSTNDGYQSGSYKHLKDDVKVTVEGKKAKTGITGVTIHGGKETAYKWHLLDDGTRNPDGTVHTPALHFTSKAMTAATPRIEQLLNELERKVTS